MSKRRRRRRLDEGGNLLSCHDSWGISVGPHEHWEYGAVNDTQANTSINTALGINDCHGIIGLTNFTSANFTRKKNNNQILNELKMRSFVFGLIKTIPG